MVLQLVVGPHETEKLYTDADAVARIERSAG
jgi:hypothetical protein